MKRKKLDLSNPDLDSRESSSYLIRSEFEMLFWSYQVVAAIKDAVKILTIKQL